MLFTSTYELAIDAKNRLSMPASIRSKMDPDVDGTGFYLVTGEWPNTLNLYPEKYFHAFAQQQHASLDPGEETDMYETVFYGRATELELDKQGRVVLPQWMLSLAGIGKKVALSGSRDHLVLWDREAHRRFMDANGSRSKDLLRLAQMQTKIYRQNGGHV